VPENKEYLRKNAKSNTTYIFSFRDTGYMFQIN